MNAAVFRSVTLALACLAATAARGTDSVPGAAAVEFRPQLEGGHQLAARFDDAALTRNRPYVLARTHIVTAGGKEGGSAWPTSYTAAARGWADPPGRSELSVRALTANWAAEHWTLTLGLQEVAWGETFGFFIADLVNPRDWSDPLFNELDWIRVPVAGVNFKLLLDRSALQLVGVPVPRNPVLAPRASSRHPLSGEIPAGVGIGGFRETKLDDAEFGFRVSHLFEWGVDLGLIYYDHLNRTPVYELRVADGRATMVPVTTRVRSVGLTLSHALERWVIRADALAHFGQPRMSPLALPSEKQTHFQAILGMDHAGARGLSVGVQYHVDHWTEGASGPGGPQAAALSRMSPNTLHWVSFRGAHRLLGGRIEPELMIFGGVGNPDVWFQPQLTWNVADAWSVTVRADLVQGAEPEPVGGSNAFSADGYLSLVRDEDRVLSWVRFRF